jgi:ectoine hydroxylase-related dioxygenase (phytanoyl-CoA dioxygenase family)
MDLSNKHEPVSDLFSGPERTAGCEITETLAEDFNLNGFITGVPLLSAEQINVLRAEMEGLMSPEQAGNPLFYEYNLNESSGEGRLFHALGAWRVSRGFHDLVFCQRIVRCAETLLGSAVRLWHDQVFVKPAADGASVAWHQDYSYWTRTVPLAHLTCWIGLDDSTEENGCVQYVPGSHRWHLLPRGDLTGDMKSVFKQLNAEQRDAFLPVPAVMKAGEASFHHPMTVHGSFENNSERPRRGVVINFMRDGVRSNSFEPLLEGLPLIPMGEKLEGQFFPLLSKRAL